MTFPHLTSIRVNRVTSVLNAILSERSYQIRRWGWRQPDNSFVETQHSVHAFTMFMEDYLNEAKHILSREAEPACHEKALDAIRKVVTLGIACFEQHGVKERDPNATVVNGRDGLPA